MRVSNPARRRSWYPAQRRFTAVVGLVLVGSLFGVSAASAADPVSYPLNSQTAPTNIQSNALYGSSGNTIYQITIGADGVSTKIIATTSQTTSPLGNWASNLSVGRDARNNLSFYTSSYTPGSLDSTIYKVANGSHNVVEVGQAPFSGTSTWGGAGYDSYAKLMWQGTNLQNSANTRLSWYNPETKESQVSGTIKATDPTDQVWNGSGIVSADYAFDPSGRLYGTISSGGKLYLYQFAIKAMSPLSVTATKVAEITGAATERLGSLYGMAWSQGYWYLGSGDGMVYRVNGDDTSTRVGQVSGIVVGTGDYVLNDLASSQY